MIREYVTYELHIEKLDKAFPDKELLTKAEVGNYLGIDKRTVESRYKFVGKYISKVGLAYLMSLDDREMQKHG